MLTKVCLSFAYYLVFILISKLFFKPKLKSVFYSLLIMATLLVLAYLNEIYVFIEEKPASVVAYQMYREGRESLTFIVQYALVYLPFLLLDFEQSAHALNVAIHGIFVLYAVQFLFVGSIGKYAWIIFVYPAYLNFSLFGFRDPIINLLMLFFVLSYLYFGKRKHIAVSSIIALLVIGLRPELTMIILGFLMLQVFLDSKGSIRMLLIFAGGALLYLMLKFLPLAFGLSPTGSIVANIDLVATLGETRGLRAVGKEGSDSLILGGALYNFSFYMRYPIQIAASFISPLPHEIKGAAFALSFLESLYFCFIAYMAYRASKHNEYSRYLFLCGMIYMLLQAMFATNYGNVLRMRYPAHIIFVSAFMVYLKLSVSANSMIPTKRMAR